MVNASFFSRGSTNHTLDKARAFGGYGGMDWPMAQTHPTQTQDLARPVL